MSSAKVFASLILAGPLLVTLQAAAQPPTSNAPPRPNAGLPLQAPQSSGAAADTELPTFMDGETEAARLRIIDRQRKTFALEVDGKYAAALQTYCNTGFGDERCVKPESVKSPAPLFAPPPGAVPGGDPKAVKAPPPPNLPLPVPVSHELPTVYQITGFGDDLTAILTMPSGGRVRVIGPDQNGPRSQLPSGEQVIRIRPGDVVVQRPGESRTTTLLFSGVAPSNAGESRELAPERLAN